MCIRDRCGERNTWTTTIPLWRMSRGSGKKWKNQAANPNLSKQSGGLDTPLNKNRRNQLARQITMQYIITVLCFISSLLLAFFLAWFICSRITWQADNPLYYILKAFQYSFPVWGILLILAGIILSLIHIWTAVSSNMIFIPTLSFFHIVPQTAAFVNSCMNR